MELNKGHVLLGGTAKFGLTRRLQSLFCLVGQSVVYEEGSELIEKLMDIPISGMQIQRVCQHYGSAIDELVESNCEAVIPRLESLSKSGQRQAEYEQHALYVMMDGSMLYTREEEWKELKLGRIFYDSQVVDIQTNRSEIMKSIFVSHLGSVDTFLPKFERHLVGYNRKVIIGDGARWIWNWAEDNYPGATQILDFYHAKEKLVLFANHQFKDQQKRSAWVERQCDKLLDNQLEQVISTLKKCKSRNEEAKLTKQKTIAYYRSHEDRMCYRTYLDRGLMIGSGPIEAAHRSVIQQRLKLSGQKWSIKGANALANLRCYKQSNAWHLVDRVIAAAA